MRQDIRALSPEDDGRILSLWRSGTMDTVDIAQRLGVREWQVANRLTHARQFKPMVGSILGDPPSGRSALDDKVRGK